MVQQTLPQLLLHKAKNESNKVALRQKDLGIWNQWSWATYYEAVQSFAIGLQEQFSVRKAEKIGIIGDNRPEWVIAELAVQSIGAIPIGIYQDATPEQLLQYLTISNTRILIVEDQEQVDKVLDVVNELPQIEHIIYYNDKGLRKYTHPKLKFFKEIQLSGEKHLSKNPTILEEQIKEIDPTDIALITFTSGATDQSKAAQFSHENIIQTALSINEVDSVDESDDYLSFLSLAWICEQVMAIGLSLTKGLTINFPEEPSTILNDLREIGPHIIQAPPRTYENIIARFHVRMNDSTPFKKKVFSFFEPMIEKMARLKLSNQSVSSSPNISYLLGDYLVFSAIRDHLGLSRLKRAYVTGGVLNADAFEFFHGLGVNLKQTYGTVETTGFSAIQLDNQVNPNTTGKPLPSTNISLTSDGEIQIEGPGVFAGYLGSEQGKSFDTGDYGQMNENGELQVFDRIDDLITLPSGEQISSGLIESSLKKSPYIQEAVVFGKDRAFVTAMININRASVGRWAEKNQITYTSYRDLSVNSEVVQLIRDEVGKIVKSLPSESQVKRFVILPKELDVAEGELTPTQKIVRQVVAQNYEPYLTALYGNDEQFDNMSRSFEELEQETNRESAVQIISLEISQGVA
ncbi:AMP-binding protein [Bacillus tianshenii]|nr:AMP-binding protein [Bacillus tianshenii]